ncbi:inositol-pentakisphosphate 2-kinase-like isoform X1 [Chenopodium quinoa]|uniref:inositol-pentakisphosphate 2-kinase-like isoform X1 n=1 Tax=Chenopodium quinoa TaxID=63459 RepID=UPI000B777D64|nr:inositol-pentakisphosphate 2-kinase-like isoform X1 [Chenopodium quinoa]XP_021759942.1 inositol-pentakisphosphate 2-kinase-like isoform X1 [Chenopodium quinoa]
MKVVLEKKDAGDWCYRGEGAINLVLAYSGSSPTFSGKIIRVPKVPRNGSIKETERSVLSEHECSLWKDVADIVTSPNKEVAEQMYVQCVMIPLLGSEFVDPGVKILVSREFLELVERNVLSQRPGWRVSAASVDCGADSVLLMSDHSVFPQGTSKGKPCLSVEIKPKWGFLPSSSFIADENAIKKNVSRFKMHQVLKLQQQKIQQLSEYDPLDLFSGSRERIHKAFKALFANPQNNLRVFLNSSLIYGGMGGGDQGTDSVKVEAFKDNLKSFLHGENGLHKRNFVNLVGEAILKSGVLDRLLEVQKLDKFDVEGAIHAYYDIVSQPCKICKDSGEDRQLGKYSSLHSIPVDESLKIVRDYLIAATAKDCSLMISFRPREDDDQESHYRTIYLDATKQRLDVKAFFIDLDMKPLNNMEYYYELDQKIVKSYKKMVKVERGAANGGTIEGLDVKFHNRL